MALAVLLGRIRPSRRLEMTAEPSSLSEGFDRLLACLDTDPSAAAKAYETVRRKLAKFFEWRGCPDGAMYADITLERAARRLSGGASVTTPNPYSFVMGFAQNVLHEYLREPHSRAAPLEKAGPIPAPFAGDPIEERSRRDIENRRFACLDTCVGRLPVPQRRALIRYHGGGTGSRIEARKEIAAAFGIPIAVLRVRMFRIREALEHCILDCMGADRPPAKQIRV
jgi:DNA-directed RNA polymerase specialized sigma24 family protein